MAEHAPHGRRGFYTSFIQITATAGLFLSLLVILLTRSHRRRGRPSRAWGWRVPFLVSIVLLGISVWIRLQMEESPAFKKMKEEGTHSKAPIAEAFGQWKNAKIALFALLGLVAGQAVVWYTGQFYALFFLGQVLKVDGFTTNMLIAWSLVLGSGGFVFFGWLSDKIGRKPIILGGCLIAALTYFPLFQLMSAEANPALTRAHTEHPGAGGGGPVRPAPSSSTRPARRASPSPATSPRRRSRAPSVNYRVRDTRRPARSPRCASGGRDPLADSAELRARRWRRR